MSFCEFPKFNIDINFFNQNKSDQKKILKKYFYSCYLVLHLSFELFKLSDEWNESCDETKELVEDVKKVCVYAIIYKNIDCIVNKLPIFDDLSKDIAIQNNTREQFENNVNDKLKNISEMVNGLLERI